MSAWPCKPGSGIPVLFLFCLVWLMPTHSVGGEDGTGAGTTDPEPSRITYTMTEGSVQPSTGSGTAPTVEVIGVSTTSSGSTQTSQTGNSGDSVPQPVRQSGSWQPQDKVWVWQGNGGQQLDNERQQGHVDWHYVPEGEEGNAGAGTGTTSTGSTTTTSSGSTQTSQTGNSGGVETSPTGTDRSQQLRQEDQENDRMVRQQMQQHMDWTQQQMEQQMEQQAAQAQEELLKQLEQEWEQEEQQEQQEESEPDDANSGTSSGGGTTGTNTGTTSESTQTSTPSEITTPLDSNTSSGSTQTPQTGNSGGVEDLGDDLMQQFQQDLQDQMQKEMQQFQQDFQDQMQEQTQEQMQQQGGAWTTVDEEGIPSFGTGTTSTGSTTTTPDNTQTSTEPGTVTLLHLTLEQYQALHAAGAALTGLSDADAATLASRLDSLLALAALEGIDAATLRALLAEMRATSSNKLAWLGLLAKYNISNNLFQAIQAAVAEVEGMHLGLGLSTEEYLQLADAILAALEQGWTAGDIAEAVTRARRSEELSAQLQQAENDFYVIVAAYGALQTLPAETQEEMTQVLTGHYEYKYTANLPGVGGPLDLPGVGGPLDLPSVGGPLMIIPNLNTQTLGDALQMLTAGGGGGGGGNTGGGGTGGGGTGGGGSGGGGSGGGGGGGGGGPVVPPVIPPTNFNATIMGTLASGMWDGVGTYGFNVNLQTGAITGGSMTGTANTHSSITYDLSNGTGSLSGNNFNLTNFSGRMGDGIVPDLIDLGGSTLSGNASKGMNAVGDIGASGTYNIVSGGAGSQDHGTITSGKRTQ